MLFRFAPIVVFLLLCAVLALVLSRTPEVPKPLASALIGAPLPAIKLTDIDANERDLSALTHGSISIVNVFASWCVPCLMEHPLWKPITTASKVQLIGIGWKDTTPRLRAWLEEYGNPYQHVLVDAEGKSTLALGITGVPETYIVDKKGIIRAKFSAPLTMDSIYDDILPLLRILEVE